MNRTEAELIVKSIEQNAGQDCAHTLKHCFGKAYRDDIVAKELIALIKATNLPSSSHNIDVAYIVATMYYALKCKHGEIKLQSILAKVYHNTETTESMKKAIEEILTSRNATSERFVSILKKIVTSANSDVKEIDYVALCMDLSNWSEYAYKNWANEIIVKRERED